MQEFFGGIQLYITNAVFAKTATLPVSWPVTYLLETVVEI